MSIHSTQHSTIGTIAQGILKNLNREEPAASDREISLAQVLAFVDDCALKNERPTLETILAETQGALARLASPAPAKVASAPEVFINPADVMRILTSALVERTGYPVDMLEPDLDLEADLGIDTVKQVEAFAMARVGMGVEKDENFRLRDYNTLRKMVDYLVQRASQGALPTAPASPAPASPAPAEPLPAIQQPVASSAVTAEQILEVLRATMSEKTGYALDILQPDLDMEVDLGIDTITQIEVFAHARMKSGVERDENFRVRNYNTLRKMAEYLASRASGPISAPVSAAPVPVPAAALGNSAVGVQADAVMKILATALVERTGYPQDMLEPDLDLEADLGIDTVKQVEAFALARTSLGIARDENFRLRDYNTLRKMVEYLVGRASASTPALPVQEVKAVSSEPPARPVDAPPASQDGVSEEKIQALLIATLQEKTGYNTEILAPDLDLEVDLGIDTITQIESFALTRTAFGIPRDDSFRVRNYNTIRKMAGYLFSKAQAGGSVRPESQPPAQQLAVPEAMSLEEVRRFVARCEATGDVESLRRLAAHVSAKLAAPLKQLTPPDRFSGKRYEVRPVEQATQAHPENIAHLRGKTLGLSTDAQGTYKQLAKRLEAAGARVVLLPSGPEASGAETVDWSQPKAVSKRLKELQTAQPFDGLILLHTTAPAPRLADVDADTWTATVNTFTLGLYASALAVYDRAGAMAGGGWYLVATAGGGQFGHANANGQIPLSGAAGGFVKCLKRELPNARCKVVDLDSQGQANWAEQIWTELVSADPDVEVGYSGGRRYAFRDVEMALATDKQSMSIKPESVVLVSGGGRGVVYHCAKLLAQVTGARVIITGRTVPPQGNEEWLKIAEAELPAYRMGYVKRYLAAHPGATPVQGMRSFESDITRRRELHRNLEDCRTQGLRLEYKVCDMTDLSAVRRLLAEVRQQYGRIDGIVHGATIEESKSLPMKSEEMFVRTLASKAHLWQLLVQETRNDNLQFFINFGSGSGRYGNSGQSDYSAANCLVAKAGQVYGALRPGVRSVTIDWPVWVGAGIVENNRDYLERLSKAGVCVIDIVEGAYWFVAELLYGGKAGEIVIADDRTFAERGWPQHDKKGLEVTAREAGGTRYAI
ncbi:MAG TPA: SDR family NAD(P)-dependent oxidoreductase [Myxococcaceae bacterium]